MPHEQKWALLFRRSVTGWVLVAGRPAHGSAVFVGQLPPHVREFAFADTRGIIKDEDTQSYLNNHPKAQGGDTEFRAIFDIPRPRTQKTHPKPPHLDWDVSEYLGDENDGVYFGAVREGRPGFPKQGTWWAMATVDSNTGGFVDTLAADPGYSSEKAAYIAAKDAAREWLDNNNVSYDVEKA